MVNPRTGDRLFVRIDEPLVERAVRIKVASVEAIVPDSMLACDGHIVLYFSKMDSISDSGMVTGCLLPGNPTRSITPVIRRIQLPALCRLPATGSPGIPEKKDWILLEQPMQETGSGISCIPPGKRY